jgi:protoporphyrinogen oxidase
MPLPHLLRISGSLPDRATGMEGRLRHSSVLGVCMGLDGPLMRDDHWIYFPGSDVPFYRIGFPSNFSTDTAPPGCGSLYAEAAFTPGFPPDADTVAAAVVEALGGLGIIGPGTGVRTRLDITIPWAYVFFDHFRAKNLDPLLDSLKERGIISVGRYGAWEYSGMQEAVDWGIYAAKEALS